MVASDGHQALQLAGKCNVEIDLLLTDVSMPYMNGIDLAEWFASLYPETKIVFMSSFILHHGDLNGIPEEEFVLLQKPFPQDILLSVLEKRLNKFSAEEST